MRCLFSGCLTAGKSASDTLNERNLSGKRRLSLKRPEMLSGFPVLIKELVRGLAQKAHS
jgi:hypothetical protein